MNAVRCAVVLFLAISTPVIADGPGFQDPLLDKLAGTWIMNGTIAGDETVHDIVAEWVLEHQYLRMHEVSREQGADGTPLYEAIVFFGWDQPTSRYASLWLDSTGAVEFSDLTIGYARPTGHILPFVFDTGDGDTIHTTFIYQRETDTWDWEIDIERDGDRTEFARVSLSRK